MCTSDLYSCMSFKLHQECKSFCIYTIYKWLEMRIFLNGFANEQDKRPDITDSNCTQTDYSLKSLCCAFTLLTQKKKIPQRQQGSLRKSSSIFTALWVGKGGLNPITHAVGQPAALMASAF